MALYFIQIKRICNVIIKNKYKFLLLNTQSNVDYILNMKKTMCYLKSLVQDCCCDKPKKEAFKISFCNHNQQTFKFAIQIIATNRSSNK